MRGMTARERAARSQIINILLEEGYKTYAKILSKFSVNLTKDPSITGCMIPNERVIILNEGLDMDQVSVITRHEILHEVFDHMGRHIKKFGKIKDQKEMLISNYAGDFDISNQAYTDRDKETIRTIKLYGATLCGLVTEDMFPDWVNLTFEEMEEKLRKLAEEEAILQPPKEGPGGTPAPQEEDYSDEYVNAYNKIVDKYNKGEYSDEDLKDLIQQLTDGQDINI